MISKESIIMHHHAAVGIVIDNQQRILISKRPAHKLKGGFWEFPGGKLEENETPEQALVRELQEEVGIQVLKHEPLMQHHHDYAEHSAFLDVFVITRFIGVARPLEGQNIQWISIEEFANFRFLEANIEIIEVLKKNYFLNI
jgi:8-oxo-dGTP diphosphatase